MRKKKNVKIRPLPSPIETLKEGKTEAASLSQGARGNDANRTIEDKKKNPPAKEERERVWSERPFPTATN